MRFIHRGPSASPISKWLNGGVILLCVVLLLGGCSSRRPLMSTPDVYALGVMQPYSDSLPAELKTADADVLYVTDRIAAPREDGRLDYGLGRNSSLTIGEAAVNIGDDVSWEELAADARSGTRTETLNLDIASVTEITHGPRHSMILYQADGSLAMTKEGAQQYEAMTSAMSERLLKKLAVAPRKEVLIFVHGVANSFDDALYTTAELWHYLGREFVPIAYSWPAGHGGLLRGYTYDYESSEFTVFHFKRLLEWLANMTEVEGVHIIAHSRGTDVVTTAIRELAIEARVRGTLEQDPYKLRNVIVAAPDINIEVGLQRTKREGTLWAADRWTLYTSQNDHAIGISQWLFGGSRIGKAAFGSKDMDADVKMWMDSRPLAGSGVRDSVIQYQGKTGGFAGHDYFRTNPAVSSDLVLVVRYGFTAGAENGRPLEHIDGVFWKIGDDYLKSQDK